MLQLPYMLYTAILFIHISALFVTLAVGAYALYAVAFSKSEHYRTSAVLLGCIAAFEVFTGTTLALLSPTLSASALTLHIALYLGACLAVELLLFARVKKISGIFPLAATASPVLASVCLFIAALSYNF